MKYKEDKCKNYLFLVCSPATRIFGFAVLGKDIKDRGRQKKKKRELTLTRGSDRIHNT